MSTPPIDPKKAKRRQAAVEAALKDGYAPFRMLGGKGASGYEAARRLGESPKAIIAWLRTEQARADKGAPNYCPDWSLYREPTAAGGAPTPEPVRRYLFTSAQDDTDVHKPFWKNLQAFAAHFSAEIVVGPFTYNKKLFEDHDTRSGWFREEVRPFLRYDAYDVGPLVFYGEMNQLPTSAKPLTGLESYGGPKWGVFPHAKVQLVSVPTLVGHPAKQIMTTGCATVPNYIKKTAGMKAAFHHVIGATLVEVDSAGRVFCRQINASQDGTFQDLDLKVRNGRVTGGHRVEAICYGDIHREKLDPAVALATWGLDEKLNTTVSRDCMLDVLKPRFQFFHDTVDFQARNHHRMKDFKFLFEMWARGKESVEDAMRGAATFLKETARDTCRSVVVFSNHDEALVRWLREADHKKDPVNAEFYLRCELEGLAAIQRDVALTEAGIESDEPKFNVFRWALDQALDGGLPGIEFCDDNQSFVICSDAGGIECGVHGHIGINGARGTPQGLTKTGAKMNTGHTHSPSIYDGVYTSGLSGTMDQGYNRGLSSWCHAHIVTYPSGKRTLVTMQDGKWRA